MTDPPPVLEKGALATRTGTVFYRNGNSTWRQTDVDSQCRNLKRASQTAGRRIWNRPAIVTQKGPLSSAEPEATTIQGLPAPVSQACWVLARSHLHASSIYSAPVTIGFGERRISWAYITRSRQTPQLCGAGAWPVTRTATEAHSTPLGALVCNGTETIRKETFYL
ncbi:hypothetical protein SKAU_G00399080 [Synaphobranchus kaupii]|uniref:Uncharacterized protein n=1 Tax=Synaphobranchus kaupii TaxID=118154 RepID=A0A9Q1E8P6_SYNKA|nr:hypothetical protein SKAU_G00399080 [Synaphobranchus kaupii]